MRPGQFCTKDGVLGIIPIPENNYKVIALHVIPAFAFAGMTLGAELMI